MARREFMLKGGKYVYDYVGGYDFKIIMICINVAEFAWQRIQLFLYFKLKSCK